MAAPVTCAPFRVDVPQATLDDVNMRLSQTRLPVVPEGDPWAYGTSPAYLSALLDHWRERFDWRVWESRINGFEQYRVAVDGLDIHILVRRAAEPDALPVLLTHGWPGSIVEFIDVADRLVADGEHPACTAVIASLPGYGFSGAPAAPVTPAKVAAAWGRIMTDGLGFARYGAHGGDWGGVVTSLLAMEQPEGLSAIHLSGATQSAPWSFAEAPLDAAEEAYLGKMRARMMAEAGYQTIQGTRPVTLSYGLTDSPAGLAAWIAEKFRNWTDREGEDPPVAMDVLLANIMLHWLPGPGPATWMYRYLIDGTALTLPEGRRIELPTGVCSFPGDFGPPAPERWLRRSYNLVHRTIASGGGHFPGLERPAELTADIRRFFARFRS
ncbi:epoxide hydrolase family protein [Sphingomonas immobilis]|uniref:Epoxide hydrolase n=1 Tax=Sphingomonas immobilis TaxID=3063997 RepID=A0ABT9A5B1_9SPHN|nr:epoxide hydrolase family protein [Sphingomonas sp. CA1-15]MDO7843922.1 epoxide hydrolase [Sphingomonas sp. CA1-15]